MNFPLAIRYLTEFIGELPAVDEGGPLRKFNSNKVKKSNEDMILALAGQFKQLSHEPEKFK